MQEQPELQLELRGLPAFHHLLPACSGDPQIPAGCLEGAAQAGMEALAAPGSPSGCWGDCAVLGMLRAQLEALLVEKRGIFFQKAAFPPWEFPPALGFVGQAQPPEAALSPWLSP